MESTEIKAATPIIEITREPAMPTDARVPATTLSVTASIRNAAKYRGPRANARRRRSRGCSLSRYEHDFMSRCNTSNDTPASHPNRSS